MKYWIYSMILLACSIPALAAARRAWPRPGPAPRLATASDADPKAALELANTADLGGEEWAAPLDEMDGTSLIADRVTERADSKAKKQSALALSRRVQRLRAGLVELAEIVSEPLAHAKRVENLQTLFEKTRSEHQRRSNQDAAVIDPEALWLEYLIEQHRDAPEADPGKLK